MKVTRGELNEIKECPKNCRDRKLSAEQAGGGSEGGTAPAQKVQAHSFLQLYKDTALPRGPAPVQVIAKSTKLQPEGTLVAPPL